MKKTIRLTESELQHLIKESVKKISESYFGSYNDARPYSTKLIAMVESGLVDGTTLAKQLIDYMRDEEVGRFMTSAGYDENEYDENEY